MHSILGTPKTGECFAILGQKPTCKSAANHNHFQKQFKRACSPGVCFGFPCMLLLSINMQPD